MFTRCPTALSLGVSPAANTPQRVTVSSQPSTAGKHPSLQRVFGLPPGMSGALVLGRPQHHPIGTYPTCLEQGLHSDSYGRPGVHRDRSRRGSFREDLAPTDGGRISSQGWPPASMKETTIFIRTPPTRLIQQDPLLQEVLGVWHAPYLRCRSQRVCHMCFAKIAVLRNEACRIGGRVRADVEVCRRRYLSRNGKKQSSPTKARRRKKNALG